jgi:hypothetical protein
MRLHSKKHWVFTKRGEKYGRMVVNFYEGKDKNSQKLSRSNFYLSQNQLSGEIHLEIFKKKK